MSAIVMTFRTFRTSSVLNWRTSNVDNPVSLNSCGALLRAAPQVTGCPACCTIITIFCKPKSHKRCLFHNTGT